MLQLDQKMTDKMKNPLGFREGATASPGLLTSSNDAVSAHVKAVQEAQAGKTKETPIKATGEAAGEATTKLGAAAAVSVELSDHCR